MERDMATIEHTDRSSDRKHKSRRSASRNNEITSSSKEKYSFLAEIIKKLQLEPDKDKKKKSFPDISSTTRGGSTLKNRSVSPYNLTEQIKRPHKPEEKKEEVFRRRHIPPNIPKDENVNTTSKKKKPNLKLDLNRLHKEVQSMETRFQRHLQNVVKSIEKRQRGSMSPFSIGKLTYRSDSNGSCTIRREATGGSSSKIGTYEETMVKKKIANILKSSNIASFMHSRQTLEQVCRSGIGYGNTSSRIFTNSFGSKTPKEEKDEGEMEEIKQTPNYKIPFNSIFLDTSFRKSPIPRKSTTTITLKKENSPPEKENVLSVIQQIPFFKKLIPFKIFRIWRAYTL